MGFAASLALKLQLLFVCYPPLRVRHFTSVRNCFAVTRIPLQRSDDTVSGVLGADTDVSDERGVPVFSVTELCPGGR
jgi:hypothetical protein